MSHIDGHVDEPPHSCGVVKMAGTDFKLHFPPHVNQNWDLERNDRIGFHPFSIQGMGVNSVLAMNVYRFDDYETVENKILAGFPGTQRIEQLHNKKKALAKIKRMRTSGKFSEVQKEIIQKTLDYFKTPDFKKFYFKTTQTSGGKTKIDVRAENAHAKIKRLF